MKLVKFRWDGDPDQFMWWITDFAAEFSSPPKLANAQLDVDSGDLVNLPKI